MSIRTIIMLSLASLGVIGCDSAPLESSATASAEWTDRDGAASTGTCAGACGGQSAGGCWCDATCAHYGDCCSDAAETCNVNECLDDGGCGEGEQCTLGTPNRCEPEAGCGRDCGESNLPECGSMATYGPLATSVNISTYGTYGTPLFPVGERTHVFLELSPFWMTAERGTATTQTLPSALTGGRTFRGFRSLSGRHAVMFARNGTVLASALGDGFAAPLPTACNEGALANAQCQARVAGDGHLWVRADGNLYEQVGTAFQNRGGAPIPVSLWDVDSAGNVLVVGSGAFQSGEMLSIWRLAPGAGGWSQIGRLLESEVAGAGAAIEGGFRFGTGGIGTFAADGSLHLFTDARSVGNGERNKAQFHLRSRDYRTWDIQRLPEAGEMFPGHVTWSSSAFWAESYDVVRYIVSSSTPPRFDGWDWHYPSLRLNVVQRCRSGDTVTFAPGATAPVPQWGVRGISGFSGDGVATMLTETGLYQAY